MILFSIWVWLCNLKKMFSLCSSCPNIICHMWQLYPVPTADSQTVKDIEIKSKFFPLKKKCVGSYSLI
jgi:hypothetical protein